MSRTHPVCAPGLALLAAAVLATGAAGAAPQGGKDPANPEDFLWLLRYDKTKAKINPEHQKLLERLQKSKVPNTDAVTRVTNQWRFAEDGGILIEETLRVNGLIRLGRDVPNFGGKGDLVWVVRFYHPVEGITQELWVSSATGAVRALLPTREKK
jgi:hypothetical protein